MAFSSSQPADSTKIRNLGLILRNNFQAMETGDISYKVNFLNLNEQGAAPASTGNIGNIYGKEGALGQTELFYQDDAGNKTQITNAGAINTLKVGFADGVTPFSGSFYVIGMGSVTAGNPSTFNFKSGNINTVTNQGSPTSSFDIAFTTAVKDFNYLVFVTPKGTAGIGLSTPPNVRAKTVNQFNVSCFSSNVGNQRVDFDFIVIGVN